MKRACCFGSMAYMLHGLQNNMSFMFHAGYSSLSIGNYGQCDNVHLYVVVRDWIWGERLILGISVALHGHTRIFKKETLKFYQDFHHCLKTVL